MRKASSRKKCKSTGVDNRKAQRRQIPDATFVATTIQIASDYSLSITLSIEASPD